MIIVIATSCKRLDKYGYPTDTVEILASHGVDTETGAIVILPPEPPWMLGAEWNNEIGEYILE